MNEKTFDKEIDSRKAEIAHLRKDITKILDDAEAKVGIESHASYIEKSQQLWTDFMNKLDSSTLRGKKVVKDIATKVEEHPVIAIATAFSIGYVIANMFSKHAKNGKTTGAVNQ